MEFQTDGVPPAGWDLRLSEALLQFPGPIAIAHEDFSATLAIGWSCHAVEEDTYAVSVTYDEPRLHRLVVKTARPLSRTRHVPVENPLVQVANYLDRADVIAHPEKYQSAPGRPGPGFRFVQSHNLDQPPSGITPTTVTVPFDDIPVTGSRLDIEDCAVVELPWGEQTVYCTGTPADIDALHLHTATPEDFYTRRV